MYSGLHAAISVQYERTTCCGEQRAASSSENSERDVAPRSANMSAMLGMVAARCADIGAARPLNATWGCGNAPPPSFACMWEEMPSRRSRDHWITELEGDRVSSILCDEIDEIQLTGEEGTAQILPTCVRANE